jgi:hypothetical protein
MVLDIVQLVVTCVLAVAAVVSALYARSSAERAGQAVEAQVKAVKAQAIRETLHEYSQKEMRDDINCLFKWKDNHPGNWGQIFRQIAWQNNRIEDVNEVDLARRHIALHFHTIWVFKKRDILDEDDVKELAVRRNIEDILLPLVEPLEKDDYDTGMYDYYREIYGIGEKYR